MDGGICHIYGLMIQCHKYISFTDFMYRLYVSLYRLHAILIKIQIIFHEIFVTNFVLLKCEQDNLNHFLDWVLRVRSSKFTFLFLPSGSVHSDSISVTQIMTILLESQERFNVRPQLTIGYKAISNTWIA